MRWGRLYGEIWGLTSKKYCVGDRFQQRSNQGILCLKIKGYFRGLCQDVWNGWGNNINKEWGILILYCYVVTSCGEIFGCFVERAEGVY